MAKSKKAGLSKTHQDKKSMKADMMSYLKDNPARMFTLKSFFSAIGLKTHPERMLCVDILNQMLDEGDIYRNREGEFGLYTMKNMAEGTFTRTANGRNFVDTTDGTGIAIADNDTLHALPGDRVRVSVFANRHGASHPRGKVIEIIQRSERPFIGTVCIQHDTAFLLTSRNSLPQDILIPSRMLHGAVNGNKVAVRLVEWNANSRNPIGEVITVLGEEGDNEAEMHAILMEYGLPYSYPKEVEEAAEFIDPDITPEEIARREDFREVLTFTIDPRDAKDFDDAISIRPIRKENGEKTGIWEVGVHIADVSHYVREDSIIDKEAVHRATSIYLVDRTIPMLPEKLCNNLCSLRPNEEKLTYSVIFEMNEDAEVLNHRIRHTIIRSTRRFTYEEVQAVLEAHGEATECALIANGLALPTEPVKAQEVTPDTVQPEAETFASELILLNRMAKQLRERRFKCGAINFDREEVRFDIDEKGKPVSVYFKRAKDANKLVEEFMLLANRTVAESIGNDPTRRKNEKPKTLPYRIHDLPDPGKLENLAAFAARFGYSLTTQASRTEVARSLNSLLSNVKGKRIAALVENVTLRAMQKARYSTENIGHYGLAFDYYTHFTSPIRRYPDLMVHRLLTRYAEGEASASAKKYEALCEHSSSMELLASAAERSSIKYKQVEFLADKIGEEFDAHISGVAEFGIYAEIDENKCEGLINVHNLGEESFYYDERSYCLIGRASHVQFRLGDPIRIRVAKANLLNKQLDFDLVSKLAAPAEEGDNAQQEHTAFYSIFLDSADKRKSKSGSHSKAAAKAKAKHKKKGKR